MLQCKIRDTSSEMSSFLKIVFWKKFILFGGSLIPWFQTSDDICHVFKSLMDHHLCTMDSSSDSPVCDGGNSLSAQRSQHQISNFSGLLKPYTVALGAKRSPYLNVGYLCWFGSVPERLKCKKVPTPVAAGTHT